MFVRIDNTPRDYAWGSLTAIARLLGREPSGEAEAELWLGAHAGSPARIVAGEPAADLAAWIAADPETALGPAAVAADRAAGFAPHLPFLLKVLAADGPLSLQAHPSPAQAAEGFARENAAGVPLDDARRNYKDPFHKPELIYALSETFDALCGFRPRHGIDAALERVRAAADGAGLGTAALAAFRVRLDAASDDAAALRDAVAWLLSGDAGVVALVDETVRGARLVLDESGADDFEAVDALDPALLPYATVVDLADAYPGDPGIVLSLLLNRVRLMRGQALYLPAGNIHAYLRGLGVELMAASDNVLRGGLTPKHVDIPELQRVLDFTPLPAPLLDPIEAAAGVEVFRPDVPDFELVHVELAGAGDARGIRLVAPAIALCIAGRMELTGSLGSVVLERGAAVYVTPEEGELAVTGSGELFLATAAGAVAA